MIESRADYRRYLAADKEALGAKTRHPLVQTGNSMVWLTDPIYKWERLLRRCEYIENCHGDSALWWPWRLWTRWRFQRKSVALGLSIPINVCGPGLFVVHYGSVIVSRHARLGGGVTINGAVNIGAHHGGAPTIGDGVYIGPGAKLFGPITIADGVQIGANAVVCKDCLVPGAVLMGVPAPERR